MPPRTRRTSSNHPVSSSSTIVPAVPSASTSKPLSVATATADSTSTKHQQQQQHPVLVPVVEIPVARTPTTNRSDNNNNMVSNKGKQTTVSGSTPSSGSTTPEKRNTPLPNAANTKQQQHHQRNFTPGSPPVKFYEEELRKLNMQSTQQSEVTRQSPSKKSSRTSKPTSAGFSIRALAVRLVVAYSLVAYFFICPNDPSRAPAVCKSFIEIQHYRNQAINYVSPYAQPYIDSVRKQADTYYAPYLSAAKPYYSRANKLIAPQSKKIKKVYEGQVKPRLLNAVSHSQRSVSPYFDRMSVEYNKLVGPHVKRYSDLIEELYELNVQPRLEEISRTLNKQVGPYYAFAAKRANVFVNKAYPTTQHHLKNTVLPFASRTYSTSAHVYGNQVHPRLILTWEYIRAILNGHFVPALKRFNSKYISPQLNKIQDKGWANKVKLAAVEKVKEMDEDLGKADLEDEIDSLIREIKAESTAETTIGEYDGTATAYPIEPTAIDIEDKEDIIAKKIAAEEALKKETAEKRASIIALHDLYDVEIEKLGQTELKLLAERLVSLRQAAIRDIPTRFDPAMKSFKDDCSKWIARLEKYYEKANKDQRNTVEDKIADGGLLLRKARQKLAEQADDLEDEMDSYLRTLVVREQTSVGKAFQTVQNYIGEAQEKLSMSYMWLDDVTTKDWARYHSLAATEGSWHHLFTGVQNGTVDHANLDKNLGVTAIIGALKDELNDISDETEGKFVSIQNTEEKRIKGQFVGVKDAVQQGQEKLAEIFEEATDFVKGTTEPTPTDVQGTVSSIYSAASVTAESAYSAASVTADSAVSAVADNAESAYSVVADSADSAYSAVTDSAEKVFSDLSAVLLPTKVAKALDDAQSSLSAGLGVASQSLLSLAGAQPSPTDASQSASSLLAQATSYLVEVRDSAESLFASYAVEATKSARSVAGQSIEPTDLAGTASSAYSVASESAASLADRMASEIAFAAGNAQGLIEQIASDAYAALPTLPGTSDIPAYTDVSSTLASQLHQATREAAHLAGISVSPEGVAERASSIYNQASSVAASALDEASSQIHTATRTMAKAVGVTPTPENVAEYVESVASGASEAFDKATAAVREHIEL